MARLDRLAGVVKEVAQLGVVLGGEFSFALLRAVAPLDEVTLQHGLAQLVEAELLYQRGILPQVTYVFKHALIWDAAYESLLRSTRQQYQQCMAQVAAWWYPATLDSRLRGSLKEPVEKGGPSVSFMTYFIISWVTGKGKRSARQEDEASERRQCAWRRIAQL